VSVPEGFGYIRFHGRHPGPLPMDAFAVLENTDLSEVDDVELTLLGERYFMGSSAKYLARDSRFRLIPFEGSDGIQIPKRWRMTRLKGWSVVSDGVEGPPRELDDQMAKLPIVSIVPPGIVIERMSSSWSPEDVRKDSLTQLLEAIENAPARATKTITVFLDFDTERDAQDSAADFQNRGYTVEFGQSHTCLLVTTAPDTEDPHWIASAEQAILATALLRGGRYVGNEVKV
jgi:hypothetical protein